MVERGSTPSVHELPVATLTRAGPEERLTTSWLRLLRRRTTFTTTDGDSVTILAPGTANSDAGPDFRDAVIGTRHGLRFGDIELHVHARDWRAHGHATDPAYNRVILHVALRYYAGFTTVQANGRCVPTLCLERFIPTGKADDIRRPNMDGLLPCSAIGQRDDTGAMLDTLGDERFREHTDAYAALLEAGNDPGTVFIKGVMDALGYRRNREPMQRLAAALPLAAIERLVPASLAPPVRLNSYRTLLLGTAGLLPAQRTVRVANADGETGLLEREWERLGGGAALNEEDWHTGRVRPGNSPVHRLEALAALLLRLGTSEPHRPVLAALETTGGATPLFRVPGLGAGRAGDIVINVALPFSTAWYRGNGEPGTAARTNTLYERHPALPDNNVLAGMRSRLGLEREDILTARRQQGLLHISRRYCTGDGCAGCPCNGKRG